MGLSRNGMSWGVGAYNLYLQRPAEVFGAESGEPLLRFEVLQATERYAVEADVADCEGGGDARRTEWPGDAHRRE